MINNARNPMYAPTALGLLGTCLLLLGGCVKARPAFVLSAGHPAAASSETTAYTPPANPFAPVASPEMGAHRHDDHSRGTADMPGMHEMIPAAVPTDDAVVAPLGYVCPMHADVRSDTPGTCPKCRMRLVPAKSPVQPSHDHGDKP